MRQTLAVIAGLACAGPVIAETGRDMFIRANILSILYHELGHAIIDFEDLPVFGQEEDAADVASVLLVELLHSPQDALEIARATAQGYAAEETRRVAEGEDLAFWGEHSLDQQRLYTTICLHYGADPAGREELAQQFDLPRERADVCAEAFDLAWRSWTPVFDTMSERNGQPIRFVAGDSDVADMLSAEVRLLNDDFSWASELMIRLEHCEEANAFYDPEERAVIFCEEYVWHLEELYDRLQ